ncbi:MAG: uroporphyrinogen-III synthase [Alphaproteobacteria bacterium]|nr:uroporphyrinogen-III synthase [Alphaproteobacteria bacterium]
MTRLLLTRPESDNIYWAKLLHSFGIKTVSSPLLRIQSFSPLLNPRDYSGIIITSKHAVLPASGCSNLPAYAIGAATAAFAKENGFANIAAVAPTVRELLALIPPQTNGLPLLYASGEVTTVDVVQELKARGIACHQQIVYRAEAAESLTADTLNGLRDGSIGGVLLFSARTAEIFQMLTPSRDLTLFCFSKAIADACAPHGQWRNVVYADVPTAEAFEALIREHHTN